MKRLILTESQFDRILFEVSNARYIPNIQKVDNEYKTLNQILFNNKLPIPRFKITNDTKNVGYFTYTNVNNKVVEPYIYVSAAYDYNDNDLDSVLAHEMIHFYLAYNQIDMQGTHGPDWQHLANQFNTQYGLNITENIDTSGYGQNSNPTPLDPQTLQMLEAYANQFQNDLKQITTEYQQYSEANKTAIKIDYTKQTINSLIPFLSSIIAAIQRCVQKQSLNEAQDVFSIWNPVNVAHVFKNKYRKWDSLLGDMFISKNDAGKASSGKKGNIDKNKDSYNEKTLYELMFNDYPKIKRFYQASANEINQNVPTVSTTIQSLDTLQQQLSQIYSQQQQIGGNNNNNNNNNPQPQGNPTP